MARHDHAHPVPDVRGRRFDARRRLAAPPVGVCCSRALRSGFGPTEITSGFPALSARVLVDPGDDRHTIRRGLEAILRERFAITHTTLQVDHARTGLLTIGPLRSTRRDR